MQEEQKIGDRRVEAVKFEVNTYFELDKDDFEEIRRIIGVVDENMVFLRLKSDVVKLVEDVLMAEKFLDSISHSEYHAPLTTIAKEAGVEDDCVRRFIKSFKELPLQDLLTGDVCFISTINRHFTAKE